MRRASLLWGWLAENSAEIDFGALAKGGKANASETLSVSRHSACVVRCGAGVFRVRGTSHMEALARGVGKSSTEASRCSSLSHTHTHTLSLFLSLSACLQPCNPAHPCQADGIRAKAMQPAAVWQTCGAREAAGRTRTTRSWRTELGGDAGGGAVCHARSG